MLYWFVVWISKTIHAAAKNCDAEARRAALLETTTDDNYLAHVKLFSHGKRLNITLEFEL